MPGLPEELAESAADDGLFQAELAGYFAERGENPAANAARTKARALLEGKLAKEPENSALAAELAELLLIDTTRWTVLKPTEMKSHGDATLTLQADGSILAGWASPQRDTLTVVAKPALASIRAVRLETLPDPSLPRGGSGRDPNGSFFLNEFTVNRSRPGAPPAQDPLQLKIQGALASFHRRVPSSPIRRAIDGQLATAWDPWPEVYRRQEAVFELEPSSEDMTGCILVVQLASVGWAGSSTPGRFRLSVSDDPAAFKNAQNRLSALNSTDSWAKLAAAYGLNGRNVKATEYFSRALQADPKLGDDQQAQHRYHAARAAALAAAGEDKDEPSQGDAAKAKLRRQALDWLKAELAACSKQMESGPPQDRLFIAQTLDHWLQDGVLAGIRDKTAITKLPAEEQRAFTKLWADVAKAAEPANNAERRASAQIAYGQKKFAFATRLWAKALENDMRLGDDFQAQHRYHAARAAALAAAGEGRDEPPLDDTVKAKLRRQALDWLKAELTFCAKLLESGAPEARLNIALVLDDWQKSPDLAGIRDTEALGRFPKVELTEWQRSWEKVEALRTQFASLPAAKQVEEVREQLKKRNPGFDGVLTPTIANGAVTELTFNTDHVTNISPIRMLTRLRSIDIRGSDRQKGSLADLTPLTGIPLSELALDFNPVKDLSPLKGMPLKTLHLMFTEVTDLTPLGGMPLETLMLWGWHGSDLTPLKGMPLKWLNCGGRRQKLDLTPLGGSPLEFLCVNFTQVSDLSPIKDLPLKRE